jgi:catechol 2,3-dioxygenase
LNTWAGVGAPPPPPGAIGLRHFDVLLPDAAALLEVEQRLTAEAVPIEPAADGFIVRDPSSNAIRFTRRTDA